MFRILYDPSSGSVERAWLKLLVMFMCAYSVFGRVIFWTCGVCAWCDELRTRRTRHTHHRSKKLPCQTPTTHTKISQVFSVKHVQHSLRMDH